MTVKADPDEGIKTSDLSKLAKSIGLKSEQDVRSPNVRLNYLFYFMFVGVPIMEKLLKMSYLKDLES